MISHVSLYNSMRPSRPLDNYLFDTKATTSITITITITIAITILLLLPLLLLLLLLSFYLDARILFICSFCMLLVLPLDPC